MEKPPSSKRTGSEERQFERGEFDPRDLRAFADDVGVPLESLVDAIEEPEDLSIIEAFFRAPLGEHVRIAERFELLERVGEGSFGRVFLARDLELSRKVAVKVMPLTANGGGPALTDHEGQMLAALEQPNVVRIYDQGRGDDYRYLVLEWLEGETLFDWAFSKSHGEVLERYIEAGQGLAAVHRRGLVHRDFKANNVMVDGEGRAVLVDFGLTRSAEALRGRESDSVCGALTHLAPERLMGLAGDARSDQFAFCVSLWETLTGVDPFLADMVPGGGELGVIAGRLYALEGGPRTGVEFVPKYQRSALLRGLALDASARWPSMEALLEALREPPPRARWGGPGLFVALVAVLLLGIVTSAATLRLSTPTEAPAPLPMPEVPGLAAMFEALQFISAHDPKAAFESWTVGLHAMELEHPRWAARCSRVVATQLSQEGSPTGVLLASWVMERVARIHESADECEAGALARFEAADMADTAGDHESAEEHRRRALTNMGGPPCD